MVMKVVDGIIQIKKKILEVRKIDKNKRCGWGMKRADGTVKTYIMNANGVYYIMGFNADGLHTAKSIIMFDKEFSETLWAKIIMNSDTVFFIAIDKYDNLKKLKVDAKNIPISANIEKFNVDWFYDMSKANLLASLTVKQLKILKMKANENLSKVAKGGDIILN